MENAENQFSSVFQKSAIQVDFDIFTKRSTFITKPFSQHFKI